MIFSDPVPFNDALKSRKVRKLLPTDAKAEEIAKLGVEIRERAFFSAQTSHAGHLAVLDRGITEMLEGGMDAGQFRLAAKASLARLEYVPDRPGTLTDLGSDARLNLIADMGEKTAAGYGQFLKSNDPDIIDAYPCRELLRVESRDAPREWRERWVQAGGKLYAGRMIARKDDPIWTAISRFGTPYPPFDYNSGMGVEEVPRAEAEQLGVVKPSTVVRRDDRSFNKDVEASFPQGIGSGLAAALRTVFRVVGDRIILEGLQ